MSYDLKYTPKVKGKALGVYFFKPQTKQQDEKIRTNYIHTITMCL